MVAMKRVVGYLLAQQQPNGELIGHNVRIETYIIFTTFRRAKHSKYAHSKFKDVFTQKQKKDI